MVEYMPLLQEYRDECHQGESGHQHYPKESDDTADQGGPRILLLIVHGCPVLPNGNFLKPREPRGVFYTLFVVWLSSRELG